MAEAALVRIRLRCQRPLQKCDRCPPPPPPFCRPQLLIVIIIVTVLVVSVIFSVDYRDEARKAMRRK